MPRAPLHPVFVDRKTAADLLMISTDTFDAWLRAGFIPPAHIERGQIIRWHWPSVESKLAGEPADERLSSGSTGSLDHVPKPKVRRSAAA
jgi:hypothetical protein